MTSLDKIQFIVVGLKKEILANLQKSFQDLPNFEFRRTNILQVTNADCIVSPGNSYGLMDGGVDGPINQGLNYIAERIVRPYIQKVYYGEQPVGTCVLFETGQQNYKYLAHTPTMRIPTDVTETQNPYLGFRALLRVILNHNKHNNDIKTVLMTGFCTGAGDFPADVAGTQMRLAYDTTFESLTCSWENALTIDAEMTKTKWAITRKKYELSNQI
jgi:O-acetyl-ADP-ribose deacetylase (regulator of RNase III)